LNKKELSIWTACISVLILIVASVVFISVISPTGRLVYETHEKDLILDYEIPEDAIADETETAEKTSIATEQKQEIDYEIMDSPIPINTIEDLNNIRNNPSGNYILNRSLNFCDD